MNLQTSFTDISQLASRSDIPSQGVSVVSMFEAWLDINKDLKSPTSLTSTSFDEVLEQLSTCITTRAESKLLGPTGCTGTNQQALQSPGVDVVIRDGTFEMSKFNDPPITDHMRNVIKKAVKLAPEDGWADNTYTSPYVPIQHIKAEIASPLKRSGDSWSNGVYKSRFV